MNAGETRAAVSLASVYAIRMFGMFLILPVFALYAHDLPGATPALVGLGLGIYGLTQGLLQIPSGWLSDRIGRKPVIMAGLAVFSVGSMAAALAPDMAWTIAARALQGSGAVAAASAALLADLTRDEFRTRAMAVVGIAIGGSFALSLVLGPVLGAWIGVRGIFWLTAVLAVSSIFVVWRLVPDPTADEVEPRHGGYRKVLTDPRLLSLDAGIFALHFILTACFLVVPTLLVAQPGIDAGNQWMVYLAVLVISVAMMLPFVFIADRPRWRGPALPGGVLLLALALLVLAGAYGGLAGLVFGLVLFFTAFNFLEANLPARVTRSAGHGHRGAAMGVHSSCQFLGAFAGGTLGGLAWGWGGPVPVFLVCALMALGWAILAIRDMGDAGV